MPGIPLVSRETNYSGSTDQMCRQDSCAHLSADEDIAAGESLLVYCKPVELYNILQRRATLNPLFLQRCLNYKIEAKHKKRLRSGNVTFNYRYYDNKLQRMEVPVQITENVVETDAVQHMNLVVGHAGPEVLWLELNLTEDFSCPFCLVKCMSFKGLRYHLSSHDLFSFEFWVTEEYQAVNVSVRTDLWRSEIVSNGIDPKQHTFFFCSKPLRRRKPKSVVQNAKNVHPLVFDSDFYAAINEHQDKNDGVAGCTERDTLSPNVTGVSTAASQSYAEPDCVQSVPGSNLSPSAMLQFAKTRKLSIESTDPRNRALLQKRQFFHSHRAQPMTLEQVLSDRDSEDDVDDGVSAFEDRRMLDDFVDVTKDEKQMMHLWNSFVRKQRVLADGHIPWACEAFSELHGQDLARTPALLWCWRLFMVKLWNHGLLDAQTMNNCSTILERCQSQDMDITDPKEVN